MNDEQLVADVRRAFGRYRMEPVAIAEPAVPMPTDGVARPPLSGRRGMLGGLSMVGVAIALAVAFTLGVGPGHGPESAFAGWQPVPTMPDRAMRAIADTECHRFMDGNVDTLGGQLPLVAQDQRGRAALFMFGENSKYLACLVRPNDYGTYDAFGYGSARALEPLNGHIELAALGGSLNVPSPGPSDFVVIFGRTDASKLVIERSDGVDVTATVSDGIFVAWWPGNGGGRTLIAYDDTGRVIESAQPWATPCICRVEPPTPSSGS